MSPPMTELSLDALEQNIADLREHFSSPTFAPNIHAICDFAEQQIAVARAKPDPSPAGEEVAGLVALLREWDEGDITPGENIYARSADLISTLSAERDAMEGALKPFIEAHDEAMDRYPEAGSAYRAEEARSHLTWDDFARAKVALQHKGETDEQG